MKKYHALLLWLMFLFALDGCGEWGRGLPDHILAQVNEEQITVMSSIGR
jgi:hypothetical protein